MVGNWIAAAAGSATVPRSSPTLPDWLMACGQVATAVILLIGLIYTGRQLRHAARGWKLQATKAILDEIGNPMVRRARWWVLNQMPDDVENVDGIAEKDRRKPPAVAVSLDRVGFMVEEGVIPDRALFRWQRDEIPRLWAKLEPIVNSIREGQGRPNYCIHFERLATEWFDRMKRRYPVVQWQRLTRGGTRWIGWLDCAHEKDGRAK